jgi:glucose/arabinose dehydrogenase
MTRRPPVLRPLAGGLLALLVAACGAGGATPPAPPPSAEATATGAPPTGSPTVARPRPVSPSPESPPDGAPRLTLEPFVDGLDAPLDIAIVPGDAMAMLVAEQVGRLRLVRDGALVAEPFLDISDAVTAGGERGLLGVAVHPDPADGRVFVYHTALDGRQMVASYQTDPADADRAVPDSERILLAMDDQFGNHNGGGLAFGPDGFLYISTGDGGGGGDPLGSGRDLGTLLAKILRLDVDVAADREPPYAIPADNPFVGTDGARPEIWATGLRNPFRFRIDPTTGDVWIGDVGQGVIEEIDRAPAGGGGLDFGWNTMEGTRCYEADPCETEGLTLPIAEYGHDQGCSVTGGAVYRGTAQAALAGWYVFADYCSGRFWVLDADGLADPSIAPADVPIVALESGRLISAIAPGPDGELYATDHGSGELLRVVATE